MSRGRFGNFKTACVSCYLSMGSTESESEPVRPISVCATVDSCHNIPSRLEAKNGRGREATDQVLRKRVFLHYSCVYMYVGSIHA